MRERGVTELGELLTSLVETLPPQQQRLDEHHARQLEALAPLVRAAVESGHPELAGSFVPAPMVLRQVEIETHLRVHRSRGREVGIGTRLLNLGYHRRYAYSETAQSQLKLVVERVPMESQAALLASQRSRKDGG